MVFLFAYERIHATLGSTLPEPRREITTPTCVQYVKYVRTLTFLVLRFDSHQPQRQVSSRVTHCLVKISAFFSLWYFNSQETPLQLTVPLLTHKGVI